MSEDNAVYVCSKCFKEYDEPLERCPDDGAPLRRITIQTEDPLLGKILDDRYVVEAKIGQGGMGTVYRAKQLSVDRVVAIKTMHDKGDGADFIARFLREASVASKLNHPHIVSIFDFGQTEDGFLYIVMELLDGSELCDVLDEGESLTLGKALSMTEQLLGALAAAHDAGIVHRDLKPENIFLIDVPGGDVFTKILDFGIAKAVGSSDSMTKTGQVFGTPAYMSPEQCRGDTTLDARSDLYSLGCILFELMVGQTPFEDESLITMMFRHIGENPPAITRRSPRLAAPEYELLVDFVNTLLSKHPDDRYADALEAREQLSRIRKRLPDEDLALPGWKTISATLGAARDDIPTGPPEDRRPGTPRLLPEYDDTIAPGEAPDLAKTIPDASQDELGFEDTDASEEDIDEVDTPRDAEASEPPELAPPPDEPRPAPSASRSIGILGAGFVLLAGGGALAYSLTSQPPPPPEPEPDRVVSSKRVEEVDAGFDAGVDMGEEAPAGPPVELVVALALAKDNVADSIQRATQRASSKKVKRNKARATKTESPSLGLRTTKSVTRLMKRRAVNPARGCVAKHYRRDASIWPAGKKTTALMFDFYVDPSGKVSSARFNPNGSSFNHSSVNRCIESAIKRLEFGRSARLTDEGYRFQFDFSFVDLAR